MKEKLKRKYLIFFSFIYEYFTLLIFTVYEHTYAKICKRKAKKTVYLCLVKKEIHTNISTNICTLNKALSRFVCLHMNNGKGLTDEEQLHPSL